MDLRTREEDCQRLFKELEGETIDIFINNAGFGVCGSYLETDDAREEEMIRVNVEAMARLFRFAVRRMHAAGGGTILNVASSAGLLPGGPYMAGYYASKAYVVSLTRGVARELQELHSPVYVCALCPVFLPQLLFLLPCHNGHQQTGGQQADSSLSIFKNSISVIFMTQCLQGHFKRLFVNKPKFFRRNCAHR